MHPHSEKKNPQQPKPTTNNNNNLLKADIFSKVDLQIQLQFLK